MEVYDTYGRILLDKGKEMTSEFISRLTSYGLTGVYVEDSITDDIKVDTLVSAKVRGMGIACVREQNIEGCAIIAEEMVKELLAKDNISLELADMKVNDDFTYYHSVNVALYACTIGVSMGLDRTSLVELTTAGMLHDFGKTMIPREILNKNGRLTTDEFEIMKSHARLSYEKIKDSRAISSRIKEAVLSHHENVDGSGYPNGTMGTSQSLFTKILHIADVYDALTSNRPYKKAYSVHEALEYMMGGCGIYFDQKIVDVLVHRVPLYPRGHQMKLSDGRYCIVVDNQGEHTFRPLVRLMDGTTIDLNAKHYLNLTIEDIGIERISEEYEQERREMIGQGNKPTVAIVDDMRTNLEELKGILSDEYNCILLKSGYQALAYTKKQQKKLPDLFLLDINMPELDGVETARQINEITYSSVPLVFITSNSNIQTVMTCRSMGASAYILRPFQPTFIKSELRRVLTGINDI